MVRHTQSNSLFSTLPFCVTHPFPSSMSFHEHEELEIVFHDNAQHCPSISFHTGFLPTFQVHCWIGIHHVSKCVWVTLVHHHLMFLLHVMQCLDLPQCAWHPVHMTFCQFCLSGCQGFRWNNIPVHQVLSFHKALQHSSLTISLWDLSTSA